MNLKISFKEISESKKSWLRYSSGLNDETLFFIFGGMASHMLDKFKSLDFASHITFINVCDGKNALRIRRQYFSTLDYKTFVRQKEFFVYLRHWIGPYTLDRFLSINMLLEYYPASLAHRIGKYGPVKSVWVDHISGIHLFYSFSTDIQKKIIQNYDEYLIKWRDEWK